MLFISPRLHGIFDYLLALALVLAPWVTDMSDTLGPALTSVGIGMVILTIALTTDYEMGLVRAIPLSLHIFLDVILGLFLVFSPWLMNFGTNVPHGLLQVAGGALIAVSAFTVRMQSNKRVVTQYIQWV